MGSNDRIEVVTEAGGVAAGSVPPLFTPMSFDRAVSLSPDGVTLVYDCEGSLNRICWFRRTDGSSGILAPTNVYNPTWMPDGTRIALVQAYSSLGIFDLNTSVLSVRRGPFYTARPTPSPDGSLQMYQCDYWQQYDDPLQLCLMDPAGGVTLYKGSATGFSWARDGRVAYLRYTNWQLTTKSLVIERFQSPAAPDAPGVFELPGFDDATETAWSPDGTRLAVVRSGALWLYTIADMGNPVRIGYIGETRISSVTWR